MNIVRKIKKLLIFKIVSIRILSDKNFYRYCYFILYSKKLSYNNPIGFNAKIQWLKLNYRKPQITQLTDKYEVRKYVADKIGKDFLVPLIDVYSNVDEINWDALPQSFVLKLTHASGWNLICENKLLISKKKTIKKVKSWLNSSFYKKNKEWQYKNIVPRIICEQFLGDSNNKLFEIKVFCYQGKPHFIIAYHSKSKLRTIYSSEWEKLNAETKFKKGGNTPKPKNLSLILQLASKLSTGFPFVRVDFLLVNEKIYFGELTFTPARGFNSFNPKKIDLTFGEPLNIKTLQNNS